MRLASVAGDGTIEATVDVAGPTLELASVTVAVRDADGLRVAVLLVKRDVLLEWTPDVAGRMLLCEARAAVARAEPITVS